MYYNLMSIYGLKQLFKVDCIESQVLATLLTE
jgi:hypothetical protein